MANNGEKNEGIIKKLGSLITRPPAQVKQDLSEDDMKAQYMDMLEKYNDMQAQLTAVLDERNAGQTIKSENKELGSNP